MKINDIPFIMIVKQPVQIVVQIKLKVRRMRGTGQKSNKNLVTVSFCQVNRKLLTFNFISLECRLQKRAFHLKSGIFGEINLT